VRSASAQASGLARHNLQAERRRAAEADVSLCPANLTACRVSGTEDGYEVRPVLESASAGRVRARTDVLPLLLRHLQCLDTQSELESCGGCLHSIFTVSSARPSIGQRPLLDQRRSLISPKTRPVGRLGVECAGLYPLSHPCSATRLTRRPPLS
jgi:hypothetical protein